VDERCRYREPRSLLPHPAHPPDAEDRSKKNDFGAPDEITFLPLDREKAQDIEELTLP
jgi:hypothetical protein